MKKLNNLLLFVFAGLALACSSEDEEPKLVEKNVTIEVEMGGNYSEYLVTFSVHSMLAGTSTFVAPVLGVPSDLDWTQVVEQGNTYTLTYEPSMSTIEVKFASKIHSLGFVFNAVPLDRSINETIQPMTAIIRVLADGEVYEQFEFEALDSEQVSVPLAEELQFGRN
ncbi:hypothetical protein [Algoriphagus sp.]|uniref:hypothetical protein n=1 Tax=Algoriphagus sp. TaxID=1872435 RepID=UPI003F71C112